MHRARLLIIVIGIFAGTLASSLASADEIELSEDGGSMKPGYVYVEPDNVSSIKVDGEYHVKPYLERRPKWGATASLGYVTYEPLKYEPNFATGDFSDFYKNPEMPMLELQITVKRNVSFGSIAGEFGVGAYRNKSDVDVSIVDSELTLYPIRLGANFSMDALSPEPYIVPYVSGGIYTIMYKESQDSASKNGNTQLAPYFNLGAQFMLDWLDRAAALVAYKDSGLQATYVFVEARKLMKSSVSSDPNFSNDVSFATGLRVEF